MTSVSANRPASFVGADTLRYRSGCHEGTVLPQYFALNETRRFDQRTERRIALQLQL